MNCIKVEKIEQDSQDNLDSPNSVYFPSTNTSPDLKKKKGPQPNVQEELCLVW